MEKGEGPSGGYGSESGPGISQVSEKNVAGAGFNDGRNENELLDCSMESTGEDSTKSPGGLARAYWMRV